MANNMEQVRAFFSVSQSNQILILNPLLQSSRDSGQTAAQKQAAAKLALRKQLEKTLLQVSCMKISISIKFPCRNLC